MKVDQRTDQLFEMLRRVRDILSEGRHALGAPDAERWKALALARWNMLRALGELNRFKQLYVLDPICMQGSEDLTRRARRLVESNLGLLERYHRFVEHWALTSPLSVDEAYRAEAWQMGERIERQMAIDAREVGDLLRDSGA